MTQRGKIIIAILVGVTILTFAGCLRVVSFMECTGGIDGHTSRLPKDVKNKCIERFPTYDFPYKDTNN